MLISVLSILSGITVFCVGFIYYRLKILPKEAPSFWGKGKGENFEIRRVGDVPYLWSYGLPYPTDVEESNRPRQSLNGEWRMRFDPDDVGERDGWQFQRDIDKDWRAVDVPSTFNTLNSPYRDYEGVTWFLLKFSSELPELQHEFARLCFRGVLLRSTVWLNGELLGTREGGYTPFYFNVTDVISADTENYLIVKTDNRLSYESLPPKTREGHNSAWWPYGGIYRDVYLETLPNHYLCKMAIVPKHSNEMTSFEFTVLTHNLSQESQSYSLSCQLVDPDGQMIAEHILKNVSGDDINVHKFSLSVAVPRYWSGRSPQLYQMTISLSASDEAAEKSRTDTASLKTGFRTIAVEGNKLLLNGKSIFLRGISKMEDDPELGATQSDDTIERDLTLIQDMHANFIRLAHYPHNARELLQARDRGIMLGGEIAFYHAGIGWVHWFLEDKRLRTFPASAFGMKHLKNHKLLRNAQRELIEMIERDRNNPAVIMWFMANESYSFSPASGEIYRWMKESIRDFDDTRPVTCTELIYSLRFIDRFRYSSQHMDLLGLNAYHGWYYSKATDISGHVDLYHRLHPDKPIMISEFGAEAMLGRKESDGEWRAERVPPGRAYSEEYQAKVLGTFLERLPSKACMAGLVPWVFSDFSSQWFPSNPVPWHNCKGVFTRDRTPKQGYFVLQEHYRQLANTEEI